MNEVNVRRARLNNALRRAHMFGVGAAEVTFVQLLDTSDNAGDGMDGTP